MGFVFIGTGEDATILRVVSFYMKNPLNVILVTDAIEKHFADFSMLNCSEHIKALF